MKSCTAPSIWAEPFHNRRHYNRGLRSRLLYLVDDFLKVVAHAVYGLDHRRLVECRRSGLQLLLQLLLEHFVDAFEPSRLAGKLFIAVRECIPLTDRLLEAGFCRLSGALD